MYRKILAAIALVLSVVACTPDTPDQRVVRRDPPEKTCSSLNELVRRVKRGYVPERGPEISVIPYEPHYVGQASQPTHNGPWDYLAEVPLVFYGPGVIGSTGPVDEPATMADVAPTTAAMLGFIDGFKAPDGHELAHVTENLERTPRLVVTIVWDGAGDNMLAAHEQEWPFLRSLIRKGVAFDDMEIGSSPSVTPPVHATLGTGAWPRRHGVYSVRVRDESGEFVDPWLGEDPSSLELPTLADIYDAALDNKPITGMTATVNWHLGMLGHGAARRGGDRDPAALFNDVGAIYGNSTFYDLPPIGDPSILDAATRDIDLEDGELDQAWMDHDLTDLSVRYASPATAVYQEHILERLIATEGFGTDDVSDLLYVNFKQSDDAAHHWGMYSEEVGQVLKAQDDALKRLVGFLDDEVGEDAWAIILTADHGFMPYPEESGGWPIGGGELMRDVNRVAADLGVSEDPVTRAVSTGLFVTDDVDADGIDAIADWVVDYTVEENLQADELPSEWIGRGNEPLFQALMTADGRVQTSCDS
jgi:Type I phosphodiesterase / nucleotide pyrophosphatase